ncbi:MAG: cytochrome c oxidase subunit II [Acidobacteria bacterium]|nr:cytochrome c oxidase subunit II [Acidobacteriota bacterium]
MLDNVPILPEAASSVAGQIDIFYWFLVLVTAVMSVLIAALIVVFAVKYRRRSDTEIPPELHENKWVEASWIVIPFLVFMVIFFWGAWLYFDINRMPRNATDVYVVAKQWMWKFHHPGGQTEINDLHVPVGQPIRLIMISQDVIHDFYVPEFRVHTDVLPNRYRYAWFEATKPGVYNLFCSEYCGTEHSRMIGKVYVVEAAEYQQWISGGVSGSAAEKGEELFSKYACNTCHTDDSSARGPTLTGLFGTDVILDTGERVVADEGYLRESILDPREKIVMGFDAIMPSFTGQLNEEQVLQLIAYLKSLASPEDSAPVMSTPTGGEAVPPAAQRAVQNETDGGSDDE